jgi:hypothetical protein
VVSGNISSSCTGYWWTHARTEEPNIEAEERLNVLLKLAWAKLVRYVVANLSDLPNERPDGSSAVDNRREGFCQSNAGGELKSIELLQGLGIQDRALDDLNYQLLYDQVTLQCDDGDVIRVRQLSEKLADTLKELRFLRALTLRKRTQ